MKIWYFAPVIVAMAILSGCKSSNQTSGYNPQYDGLSGHTIPPVNMSILSDQAALAAKYAANIAAENNASSSPASTPTPPGNPSGQ